MFATPVLQPGDDTPMTDGRSASHYFDHARGARHPAESRIRNDERKIEQRREGNVQDVVEINAGATAKPIPQGLQRVGIDD